MISPTKSTTKTPNQPHPSNTGVQKWVVILANIKEYL